MNDTLWKNILDFNLDYPLSEYGFSTRLENENFWTINFAQGAIVEYKKFMYLAAVSDEMVSPSELVDIVWHQHLVFTQSYDKFCSILGKKIAHVPSTHTRTDFAKFKLAKETTQKLYHENFGDQPSEFWDYNTMYGPLHMQKSVVSIDLLAIISLIAVIPVTFWGYFVLKPLYVHINNPYFVAGYVALMLLSFVLLEVYNRYKMSGLVNRWNPAAFAFKLSARELIYLNNGLTAVIHGVVNQLVKEGKISVLKDDLLISVDPEEIKTDTEYCVIQTLMDENREFEYYTLLKQLITKPAFNKTARAIDAFERHIRKSKIFLSLFGVNLVLFHIIFILGAVRVVTGYLRDKPVTIIGITLIAYLLLIIAYLYRLRRTTIANAVASPLYEENMIRKEPGDLSWEWNYLFLGTAFFVSSFDYVRVKSDKMDSSSSDSGGNTWFGGDGGNGSFGGDSDSGGSSCGSSCGSGCGGCGGD